jgi:hypothetical protein
MADEYDSPWKEIIEDYFSEFMAFFFPQAHADIDWQRGYESLDQELQQIVRDAALGRRLADKLMRVWRRDGQRQMVLVHIEIQGQYDADFAKRMYIYNYRLFDRYDESVVSLAILGDERSSWRPNQYTQELWGCRTGITFPVIKLLDYQDDWPTLEASVNPFAVVVMAHLRTQMTRRDAAGRLQWKLRLVRQLYERGLARQDILDLFRFIDCVMALPEALESRFRDDVIRFEAEMNMPYITSIERRGIEQGIEQGKRAVLRRLLTQRFGVLPSWVEPRLDTARAEQLDAWTDRLIESSDLDELFSDE